MSADTRVRAFPAGSLATMAKDDDPRGGTAAVATRSILASGGASRRSAPTNSVTTAAGPSTSANTPSASFPTNPLRPRPVASV